MIIATCLAAVLLKGPFLILSTPYHDDGQVDWPALVAEADFAEGWEIPGVIWPQSNDSIDLLSREERFRGMRELVGRWREKGTNATTRLTIGVSGDDTEDMLVYAREAERLAETSGVDFVLCARPPYNGTTEAEIEAYFEALAGVAKRPVIIQTFVNETCPAPSTDLLVRLAERHPGIYGWVKEESDGNRANERQALELAARPPMQTVFSAWGGWQWLYQRRQLGTEGLITERIAYSPIVSHIWKRMTDGDSDGSLTEAYALYRLLIDQRNLECGSLRGYSLHYFVRLGLFKNMLSRNYAEKRVTPSGTYPIGDKSRWVLEEVKLTDRERAELDVCYDDMMRFVRAHGGKAR